jgi:hypothetical protein
MKINDCFDSEFFFKELKAMMILLILKHLTESKPNNSLKTQTTALNTGMNMNLNVKFQNQRRCKIVNVIWS